MSKNTKEPILVLNPESGRYINIAPLVEFVNEDYLGHFYEMSKGVDAVIKLLACTPFAQDEGGDNVEIASRFSFLYSLRDVINSISEFKEDRQE